jgi:hypothetical protein
MGSSLVVLSEMNSLSQELSATDFKGLDVQPADVDLLIELDKLAS